MLLSCPALITRIPSDYYLFSKLKKELQGKKFDDDEEVKTAGMEHFVDKEPECGPGTAVGIATGHGLDGPGIESRWGRDIPHLSRPALVPTQPPIQGVPGLSWG